MVESEISSETLTQVDMIILRINCNKCGVAAFNLTNSGAELFVNRHKDHISDLMYLARITLMYLARITSPLEFAGKELWMQLKGK